MNEEIRKLLSGYATNTLSESEQKALFEAALQDQELFDALEDEQALRNLLDDDVSRKLVRQSLAQQARGPWWSRWWTWASATAAVAAGVFAFFLMRPAEVPHQAEVEVARNQPPAQVSAPESPPKVAPATPAPVKEKAPVPKQPQPAFAMREKAVADSVAEPLAAAAPAPPPPPAAVPTRAPVSAQALGSAGVNSIRAERAAVGSIAPLSYSFVERDSTGADQPVSVANLKSSDVIRIRVSALLPGTVVLQQQDAAGGWTPVGGQVSLVANSPVTLDVPIPVESTAKEFRLVLNPQGPSPIELRVQVPAR